jgi:hypothetical protein
MKNKESYQKMFTLYIYKKKFSAFQTKSAWIVCSLPTTYNLT